MESLTTKEFEGIEEATEEFEVVVTEEEVVGTELDSKERDLPVYHHYTHSMWSDGAALFAAKQIEDREFTLIVINKDIGAWEEYDIEPGGFMSGGWNYAPIPDDIGLSVWMKAKLNKEVA